MNLQQEYDDATHQVIGAGRVLANAVGEGSMDVLFCRGLFEQAWARREAAYEALRTWKEAQ